MAQNRNKVRRIIRAAAKDPKVLQQLKTDPNALARRFRLTSDELAALVSADRLLVLRGRIGGTTTYTFTTGTTITGRFAIGPRDVRVIANPSAK